MAETKSFRLDDEDMKVIDYCKKPGDTDTDGVKAALRFASITIEERRAEIERIRGSKEKDMKGSMERLNISFEDLGADYKAIRQEEGQELLRRLRQGLKKQGKKMLPEILEAECRRYGVELRGGNTGVQNSQNEQDDQNSDTEEKVVPIGGSP